MLEALTDILFPRFCLACGVHLPEPPWRWLCPSCLARIEPLGPSPCPVCAGPLGPTALPSACADCRRLHPRFDASVAVGRYDGLLGELVSRLKYGRDTPVAWPLGDLLAGTVALWPPAEEAEIVVPMPIPLRRRLRRGFNQAELLAGAVSRRLHLPLGRFSLGRRRSPLPQAGLSRSARLRSPAGTFAARRLDRIFRPVIARLPRSIGDRVRSVLSGRIGGRRVLLIDDVLTTGATASEAARTLKEAGARAVLVAVVARA